jgi:hypothetical protein
VEALADPKVRARITEFGAEIFPHDEQRPEKLGALVKAAALPAMSCDPGLQSYPSRPVRLVVGYAPGGTTDIAARLIGQWLSDRLSRQFIIKN